MLTPFKGRHFRLPSLVSMGHYSTKKSMSFQNLLLLAVLLTCLAQCATRPKPPVSSLPYPNQVGDIQADASLDDPNFTVCQEANIPQYYSLTSGYTGEKPAVDRYFRQYFRKQKAWSNENGYLTVRFVVNCRGKTGRFRVQEMSPEYQPKKFSRPLQEHLLQLTRQVDGWLPGRYESQDLDYYQYLCFTLKNGNILRITP